MSDGGTGGYREGGPTFTDLRAYVISYEIMSIMIHNTEQSPGRRSSISLCGLEFYSAKYDCLTRMTLKILQNYRRHPPSISLQRRQWRHSVVGHMQRERCTRLALISRSCDGSNSINRCQCVAFLMACTPRLWVKLCAALRRYDLLRAEPQPDGQETATSEAAFVCLTIHTSAFELLL